MFWKRKSKKQDGQEATGSAAEGAVDTQEEVEEETESEAAGVAAEGEKTTGAEKADETVEADESVKADKAAKDDADSAEAEDSDDAEASTETETETETETADSADEDSEDSEDEPAKAAATDDVFDDEGVPEPGVTGPDSSGIIRVRSEGVFEFDGTKHEIVSNTWIVDTGDDGVIVIDPAHDADAILKAVGDREIYLVACTNGYSPHIESAIKVAEEGDADIALHPREMRIWRRFHGAEHRPEIEVEGEGSFEIGDLRVDVIALPGTSPGSVGYYIGSLGVVFSGDTLRKGEPGKVGDSAIDYSKQLASIGEALLSLPGDTRVLPDQGPATTIAAENVNFDSWV
ncbi:glyoxylase-like metal-dependent hydrolase (beta-lactamase superfamily II) [Nocardiopsis sp. Huas11]|uniref:MBL fold metallo-hydrolase n=1 Tax=Nocardiopsis sp. Huas11 TaxID=2183912 RepID=UPI000EB2FDE2|nr:MBL fold metallo-hydrolase [Nocardiopsis sp. Huas11]RKS05444.1 glyoxylase-like metal-dependent hydrolase (beta-lactamase superfamily II) [Nocardiopsis sp. Huas11]